MKWKITATNSIASRQRFSAQICKIGINPCVDVPRRVSESFGKRGYVPVKGILNGLPIRATFVPAGEGRHRLYINGEMRKAAKVGVGDTINLILEIDSEPRKVPIPPELEQALKRSRSARTVFSGLLPSRRKEILTYLNWLKTPEARKRNVEKILRRLRDEQRS